MDIKALVDGHTLQQFDKLLEMRTKYMGQSSQQALVASAIDILRSIRAATTVAKLSKIKPQPKLDASLTLSFRWSGSARVPKLMRGKAVYHKGQNERIIYADVSTAAKVYSWTMDRDDKGPITYYVTATGTAQARSVLKTRLSKRLTMYKGLAKRALGELMHKTANVSVPDKVNSMCAKVAKTNTSVKTSLSIFGKQHSLTLVDDLDYALKAIKGGQGAVDVAIKKASNKITSVINRKCKNLLNFQPLELPFPEVKSRK